LDNQIGELVIQHPGDSFIDADPYLLPANPIYQIEKVEHQIGVVYLLSVGVEKPEILEIEGSGLLPPPDPETIFFLPKAGLELLPPFHHLPPGEGKIG
jgi:hypothetical protein